MDIEHVKRQVFICCPFDLLVNKYLSGLLEERINPEIGLGGEILDQFRWPGFKKTARILKEEGLNCTIHAPFTDLSLGAIDKKVRKVSIERMRKALEIANLFEARSLVCHTGFDHRHYNGSEDLWKKNALESLVALLEYATPFNIPIMIENVFELTPEIHREIFRAIKSPLLGFCLDIGHINVFSKTGLDRWLTDIGDRLGQLHLHDNNGVHDDHLPIGHGILDFDSLFSWLHVHRKSPIITLEPHEKEGVIPALEGLAGLLETYPVILHDTE